MRYQHLSVRGHHSTEKLLLVMMSKYSKFGFDTFNTFWVMGYYGNNDNNLAITIHPPPLKKNNKKTIVVPTALNTKTVYAYRPEFLHTAVLDLQ